MLARYCSVVLSAVGLSVAAAPIGLFNDGNYCYAAAILQNLFHLPNVRESVLQQGMDSFDDNQVDFALACLFARMQNSTRPVHPEWDFYPAFQRSVQELGFGLRPRQSDDSQAFFTWAAEGAMPWMRDHLFHVQYRVIDSFQGIVFKNRSSVDDLQINAIANMFPMTATKVQSLLQAQTEEINSYSISSTGDAALDTRLIRAGAQLGKPRNTVVRTVSIERTGPILPIHLVRMWDFSDRETVALYPAQMLVSGCKYHLMGMVIAHPGHYSAIVQTNVHKEQWHHLNDAAVIPMAEAEALSQGHRAFMLFYAKDDEFQRWKADPDVYHPIPSDAIISKNLELAIQRRSKL